LVHNYKHGFSGFAAMLTEEQAKQLAGQTFRSFCSNKTSPASRLLCDFVNNSTESPEVISVEPSRSYTATTTRSWDFLGLGYQTPGDLLREGRYGEDIIIGVVDSGPYSVPDLLILYQSDQCDLVQN
jgi:hypothetical protein